MDRYSHIDWNKPLYWHDVPIVFNEPDIGLNDEFCYFTAKNGDYLKLENDEYQKIYISTKSDNLGWPYTVLPISNVPSTPSANIKNDFPASLIDTLNCTIAALRDAGYEVECTVTEPVKYHVL